MSRGLLFEVLDRDLACAVALGFVDLPKVAANVQTITIHDANMRPVGCMADWLTESDPLDAVTREYLRSRQEAGLFGPKPGARPWEAATRTKVRDEANKQAIEARARGKTILEERGVLARAREEQLHVLE